VIEASVADRIGARHATPRTTPRELLALVALRIRTGRAAGPAARPRGAGVTAGRTATSS
jgi:hypothetical protein